MEHRLAIAKAERERASKRSSRNPQMPTTVSHVVTSLSPIAAGGLHAMLEVDEAEAEQRAV